LWPITCGITYYACLTDAHTSLGAINYFDPSSTRIKYSWNNNYEYSLKFNARNLILFNLQIIDKYTRGRAEVYYTRVRIK